jgi:ribonuclease HI
MKKIDLYTDGACSGNPGKGGWGALLRHGLHEKELSGFAPDTTNNRMELTAVIEGLKAIKKPAHVTIFTDSRYVIDGITLYLENWKENGFKTADKKPVKNQDLWCALDHELMRHRITWQWVKGHSGHVENERVDALARHAISQMTSLLE